jgi:hypothetical protein
MRKHFFFGVVLLSQMGATDCGQVVRDPGFDLWCGDELCAWKVTAGDVKRVPTWNDGDSGVELVGSEAAIQQLSPVDSGDGHCRDNPDGGSTCMYPDNVCIEFSLLADIASNAVVDLNVDVFGDGTIDHSQRLPIGAWQQLSYKIVVPQVFAGIRFELAKSGPGSAKLANIGAELAKNCDGLPLIELEPAPLGSPCNVPSDCASGLCSTSLTNSPFAGVHGFLSPTLVCVECGMNSACDSGEVCGVGIPLSAVQGQPMTCLPEASKAVGEYCVTVDECSTGLCEGNRCAPACSSYCSSGESCTRDEQCASLKCVGAERFECRDGRACNSPAQCPFESGLENGACNKVGVVGGVCQ